MKPIRHFLIVSFFTLPWPALAETGPGSPPAEPKGEEKTESADSEAKKVDVKREEKEEDPILEFRGRIHTRWELEHLSQEYDDPADGSATSTNDLENKFLIRRARVKFIWRPTEWVMGVVHVGVERVYEDPASLLRDAYLHLSPLPYLELRVGQFKKQFSGLELRSPGRLRVAERGEGNNLIVEDLRYGDRDLGMQLSGRLIKSIRLDYAVGVYNGTGTNINAEDKSKDMVARLRIRPIKHLRVGANGSFKFFDDDAANVDWSWAAGGDARLRIKGFTLHLEGLFAEDYSVVGSTDAITTSPFILNGVGFAAYRHRFSVSWGFAVEPVFKFEFLDPSADIVDDEVFAYSPGVNMFIGEYLRFMVHGEFRRSKRNSAGNYPDREILMAQLCFDI